MGSDLTAAQLAEIVGPVRDLLPEHLHGWSEKWTDATGTEREDFYWEWGYDGELVNGDDATAAVLICEAVLTRWLDDKLQGGLSISFTGTGTRLEKLVAAVVAARTEKK